MIGKFKHRIVFLNKKWFFFAMTIPSLHRIPTEGKPLSETKVAYLLVEFFHPGKKPTPNRNLLIILSGL